jgi:energy-coupling factor transport system permease protein
MLAALNPLTKIAAILPALGITLFAREPWVPAGFIALSVVVLIAGARLGFRRIVLGLAITVLCAAVLTTSFALWTDSARVADTPALAGIGDWSIRTGAVWIGLATALRLIALVALALISGLTTSGPDLVRAMVQHLRVPYRLGYAALAAYRFVPRLRGEATVVAQAHRARGVTGARGPAAGIRRRVMRVVPVLAGGIRHAERVALAMDSRAFGAYPTRTERYESRFRGGDIVFACLMWAATAAIVIAVWTR